MAFKTLFQTYYRLTKPGIIYGNVLTATGGFLLASRGHIDGWLLWTTLAGTSLVIASGCVFNNYIDRNIDKKMARTKKRALANGLITPVAALTYAAVLGVAGFAILAFFTNALVVSIGVVGYVDYIMLYGISKRRSTLGTIVGSISGATPVLAGYCAVAGELDAGAIIIFLIMVLWQMPHFYAIAMYRFKDYAAVPIPVMPVKKGMFVTKVNILVFIIAYTVANAALTVYGYAGYAYMLAMSTYGLAWLWLGAQGLRAGTDDKRWARKMFFFSLVGILLFTFMLSVDALLP